MGWEVVAKPAAVLTVRLRRYASSRETGGSRGYAYRVSLSVTHMRRSFIHAPTHYYYYRISSSL
jgi:hypothetical protein